MKYSIIIVSLLLFIACELKIREIDAPKNLIPRDSMVLILEDLMLLESHIQNRYPQVNQFKSSLRKSGDTLLRKYDISFRRFEKSFDYYASYQDDMKAIYNQVLENMNKKLNELQSK
jgi:hypothetical protein